ncbi:lipid A biosynthesis acyltransferase [Brumimicrobium sp.]|uniref:LpxL/LpxP family acyltransferase n=1 Tax=Brumimicrobium sp. TaxID=2029867 RepID=UPI002615DB9C|nr:lipid A biosynthesis acyltransferase [uncultured Brumimicrobium sp.]
MSEWKGASKGSVTGYKIFVFFIHNIGLRFAYFILIFVALYYFLFSWSSSKSIYYYLRKRQGFSVLKSFFGIYRSYYVFGQTLIDRIMISSGKKERFTYEFDGIEKIKEVIQQGNGAVLISAHVGNFEISEYFLEDLDESLITNIVTTDLERKNIKEYLENLSLKSRMKYIIIQEDMSHIYEFNEALSKNEFICITGDRYMPGSKFLETDFMGEAARFPAGPFKIGSRLRVPVLFVYVMKESATHYHLYARVADVKHRKEQVLLESYVNSISTIVDKYPYQWFNYFHFWNKP